jgi:hypothetical protein
MQRGERYAPLGSPPGMVAVDVLEAESPSRRVLGSSMGKLPQAVAAVASGAQIDEIAKLVFTPGRHEAEPLIPPMLRPGPGSAARFIVLYTLLTWLATFLINLPWLPWLLWADYGPPVLGGVVPV